MSLLFSNCSRVGKTLPSRPKPKTKANLGTKNADVASLDTALYAGNYVACFELLDRREGLGYRDHLNDTVLHTAAMRRSAFCGELIRLGVNPLETNQYQETALHVILTGDYNVVIEERQFRRMAGLDLQDVYLQRLRRTIVERRGLAPNQALSDLLQGGCDPNAMLGDRKTPLMVAIQSQASIEVLLLLIKHGADPSRRDKVGRSAVDWASYTGRHDVVEPIRWATTSVILLAANQRPFGVSDINKFVRNRLQCLPSALVREFCTMMQYKAPYCVVGCLSNVGPSVSQHLQDDEHEPVVAVV